MAARADSKGVPIGRIFARFFDKSKPVDALLDATERQRLAHRRRVAERELRELSRTLKRIGCSTCLQQTPSRGAIRMEQTASALRSEISAIDKRLAAQ